MSDERIVNKERRAAAFGVFLWALIVYTAGIAFIFWLTDPGEQKAARISSTAAQPGVTR